MLKTVVRGLPAWSISYMAGQDLIAPCYHMVNDRSPIHTKNLYRHRGTAEFRQDLDYLLRHFKPLSLQELSALTISGDPLPKRSFFLSFDDGFREMSEVVADICLQKGVPATFFLTTGFLNNRKLGFRQKASVLIEICKERRISSESRVLKPLIDAVYPNGKSAEDVRTMFLSIGYKKRFVLDECAALMEVDFDVYLRTALPYLTEEQVAGLVSDGFSIGGHSVDHALYADLTLDEQLNQTIECMKELGNRLRPDARAFAFPFVSDGVEDAFFDEVFERKIIDLAFCIGRMPNTNAARALQRFGVEAGESIPIQELLKTHIEGRFRQRLSSCKKREISH